LHPEAWWRSEVKEGRSLGFYQKEHVFLQCNFDGGGVDL
jgi:hypothetical protein